MPLSLPLRTCLCTLPLIVAGPAVPGATGSDRAGPLDGTYDVSEQYPHATAQISWIIDGGRLRYPYDAPLLVTPVADGWDVHWSVPFARRQPDTWKLQMALWHLQQQILVSGMGGQGVMASASAGGEDLPGKEEVEAHVAADGTITGIDATITGTFPAQRVHVTGKRVGPPRPPRTQRSWWYSTHGDAQHLVWTTAAVELDFMGVDGSGQGSGTVVVDGEGSSSSSSNTFTDRYADRVLTLQEGKGSVTITDGGSTLIAGRQRFDLTTVRPSIRVWQDGRIQVLAQQPVPKAGPLDGQAFTVTVHALDVVVTDTLRFAQHGVLLSAVGDLGPPPPYTLQRQGAQLHFSATNPPTGLADLSLALDGTIEGDHITGTFTLSDSRSVVGKGTFAGERQAPAR